MNKTTQVFEPNQVGTSDYVNRLQNSIRKSEETGRPFAVLLIQMANFKSFRQHRPNHVVTGFLRELHKVIRGAVHPSQHVGIFQDGLGLVFDMMDVGQIDQIAKKLVVISQHVIRTGKYNDLSSRWTEIISQFLFPNKPSIIYPCVGWAICPRDGRTPKDIIKRAFHHIAELQK